MGDNSRLYIASAFALGVVLTLGLRDVWPQLESSITSRRVRRATDAASTISHEDLQPVATKKFVGYPGICDGIEGAIGNTPLIRIKSLSDATGCEILAKAEV